MQEPGDQRLVEDERLSVTDLNEMEQPTTSTAVTESTVNRTEDDSERWRKPALNLFTTLLTEINARRSAIFTVLILALVSLYCFTLWVHFILKLTNWKWRNQIAWSIKIKNTTKVDKINELFHVNTTQFYIELGKTTSWRKQSLERSTNIINSQMLSRP